ncbi:MAG: PEP-CTERM sorting domain-containing protein [Microcystaceae cyanobacterium]
MLFLLKDSLKTFATLAAGSAAAIITVDAAQAGTFIPVASIDPFTTTQAVGNADNSSTIGPDTSGAFTSDLLGNVTRTISGNITGGSTSPAGSVSADSNSSIPGQFALSNGIGRQSEVNVSYDFTGPVDFTMMGSSDSLGISITDNDLPMDIIFNFTDADGTMGSIMVVSPGSIPPDPTMLTSALFSDVTSSGGTTPGLDFSMITDFSFDVNTQAGFPSADISFDFVASGVNVPEPGTLLGLAAFGIAGLASRRLKK